MEISKEQKEAIEYLKTRLYGNENYKYIYVAQEDLRIFINLIDSLQKENESWKSYSEELEEEQIEKNNKKCELEFEVENLKKENEELKEDLKYVLNQTLGAFEKNWCIDWNFTEIREKYNLESE